MSKERPLLIPLLCISSGLVISDQTGLLLPISVPLMVLCCLLLSCLIRNKIPFVVCMSLFFLTSGMCALTPWKTPDPATQTVAALPPRIPLVIEGSVLSRPVVTAKGSNLLVRSDRVYHEFGSEQISGNIMLHVGEGDVTCARGDRIRFTTRISLPRRLGLPGEFDYPRYLAYQGVAAIGRVASKDDIVLMRGTAEDSILRRLDLVAVRLGDFIRSAEPDQAVSSVLAALLIGDQKRIPVELSDAYTRAGVNHILSISGFHVGIIGYFIVMITLYLATRSEYLALHFNLRRTVVLLSLPTMLLYLFLTGAAPATARSFIMLAAFVLSLYAERETEPINVLLLAAFLLVLMNPPVLFDISFQLSFLALWGIVIFVPPVMEYFKSVTRSWLRTLIQFVAASFAATGATVVPVLFTFNVASINGIFSNFLIVPLLGYGAVLAGFCALPLVYLSPPAATLLVWIAARMVALSNWIILLFAQLPVVTLHGINSWDMLLFLMFMCCVTFFPVSKAKTCVCSLIPVIALMLHLATGSVADGRLHITMLSVGQAESLLLKLPDGTPMLVDGGGYLHETGHDFGERILAPALFKLGIRRLDHLVLTHSHPDHVGGLPFLARNIPIGTFYEASPGGAGDHYLQLQKALTTQQTKIRQLAAGDELTLAGKVKLRVLSPQLSPRRTGMLDNDMDMNEDSLVFRISFGSFSMLFTADAGFLAEESILRNATNIRSTVLKVGHHGSRYSSSERFLLKVAPRIALISAGSGNSFGLPSPDTLHQLERHGIQTYRTDHDGTIELVTDGNSWTVQTPYRSN
jgi:competence protein ComEC